ncbi:SRPBCC family protein [Kitasatospora sp. NPDC059408]|uniref:SRPBCC family protein n=1 Tax=Kitasatospora sp. NPDC059408 TaxID=3346823 RepID=UPI0036C15B4B
MAGTTVSTVVEAPAGKVWELIGDFHALGAWHPDLPPSRRGNDLGGTAVGAVRLFELGDTELSETLLGYDDGARSYTYGFADGTFELSSYRATLRVVPVTESDAAFVEWSATYDVEREHREASTALVHGVFTAGLRALRERFAS